VTLPVDPQQRRFLELLDRAAGRPVSYAVLRAAGISFPAAVAAELALQGYVFERVFDPDSGPAIRRRESRPG
jgi:hypothetical protein